jgi:serine/threonine protein kinase
MFSVTTRSNFFSFVPFQVRNEKARRYLSSMRKKDPVPFCQKFPNADPLGLKLLEKLLAFDPKDRLTAEEVVFWCYLLILISHFFLTVASCL